MKRILSFAALLALATSPAFAHPGHGEVSSFSAGLAHPLGGIDHIAVMVAVGLWAALKGGRALWAWPAAFVGVMLLGGALGMAHVALPLVEPGILASVVVLGLMVTLAVDLPVWLGAAIVAVFALLHGHAHGSEVAETMSGLDYMAGFALATATLHLFGIGFALAMARLAWRPAIRVAGALCVAIGAGLLTGTAHAYEAIPHTHSPVSMLPGVETSVVALLLLGAVIAITQLRHGRAR